MIHAIERLKRHLTDTCQRMLDPRKQTQDWRLRLDDFTSRFSRHARMLLTHKNEQLVWWQDRLFANSPLRQIHNLKVIVDQIDVKLFELYNKNINNRTARLRELAARLEALSPIAILKRGYSITRTIPHSEIVLDPETVSINQDLEVIVSKGTLTCRVKDKSKNGPKNI